MTTFLTFIKFAQDITDEKVRSLDFQSQIEAVRRSNAVVEFDVRGVIQYANDLFVKGMGYSSAAAIIGKHHSMFLYQQEPSSEEYRQFWHKLSQGEFLIGEFRRKKADGTPISLKGTYNPVKDVRGKTYKIVKYAQMLS